MEEVQVIKIGDAVEYFDEYGRPHIVLVTAVHGPEDRKPAINIVYVSDDSAQTDSYGRQITRQTSCVHEDNQSAHGRYWRFMKD